MVPLSTGEKTLLRAEEQLLQAPRAAAGAIRLGEKNQTDPRMHMEDTSLEKVIDEELE